LRYAYGLSCLAGSADSSPTILDLQSPATANGEGAAFDAAGGALSFVAPPQCRVRLQGRGQPVTVCDKEKRPLSPERYDVVEALVNAYPEGLTKGKLERVRPSARDMLTRMRKMDGDWAAVIHLAGSPGGRYRIG
jgi:hypothetical protein